MNDNNERGERSPDDEELKGASEAEDTISVAGAEGKRPRSATQPPVIPGYHIVGLLGEGGMGAVWEAVQDRPHRRVALKVMRREHQVDDLHARLFHREAETLARLKHPNIAAIYETGHTDDGRDYFAMELAPGRTLDQWLSSRPQMITADELGLRLRVFRTICAAVNYAHQRGVIHRDLKPSNIILGDSDQETSGNSAEAVGSSIKILDFGLARITDSDVAATMVSEIGTIKGTLPYMSPEQARGEVEAIDVRTDVYALGVILYEMLAGRRPYDIHRAALAEAIRVICSEPPLPLADSWSGTRRIDADLETIVGKALEKEADRRYGSAAALSEDIDRYLSSQPIMARPPSARYQLKKMVQRNRPTFAALAAGLVALVVAVAATSWGLIHARRAERRAAESAAVAQAVNDFLNYDLLAAVAPSDKKGKGKDVPMREVLAAAADNIDAASRPEGRFGDTPLVEAAIRRTLGETYRLLGHYDAAEPQLVRALEIRESLPGDDPGLARALFDLGSLYEQQGHYDRAGALLARALAISTRIYGETHESALTAMSTLARVYGKEGRSDEAEPLLERALELQRTTLGEEHPETILTMNNLANFYQERGRFAEAETLQMELLEVRERIFGEGSMETMRPMNNLGNIYASMGRFDEAIPLWNRALELKVRYLGEDHPSTLNTLNNLAELEEIFGNYSRAESLHQEVIEARVRVLGPEHPMTLLSMVQLAFVRGRLGRLEQAETLALQVVGAPRNGPRRSGRAGGGRDTPRRLDPPTDRRRSRDEPHHRGARRPLWRLAPGRARAWLRCASEGVETKGGIGKPGSGLTRAIPVFMGASYKLPHLRCGQPSRSDIASSG
jgi:serine/threonine protein kinase/Flp pilus assembly protein TadD